MTTAAISQRDAGRTTRATLLTILGEAVLRDGRKVWQETLVRALETSGATTSAARQAVSRASRDGWLTSERVGRRALMSVTDSTRERLVQARERAWAFGAPVRWDGRWLLITLSVPEERRDQRYQIRSQLSWLGFGSLGNGVWISPHVHHEDAAIRVLQSGPDPIECLVFTAEPCRAHDPKQVARATWDLDELRVRYRDFHRTFSRAKPRNPSAIFAVWIRMITEWRKFPGMDPELPDSLLPDKWPRQSAYELFLSHHKEWADLALEYFRDLEGS
ncbi:PaaX family transcriptional regulator C-terminal domain-containing protein [Frankia sp. Cr1]|uniref:PaaX family transcriptional regulator n=1 Tax=Frankia sp. Cr1 TaxID=3073931 RepID=UPI002AD584D3|nr:PaaX family transcriptional regulator C-terminal domain-containing protein [Frankia sp. Cr1]